MKADSNRPCNKIVEEVRNLLERLTMHIDLLGSAQNGLVFEQQRLREENREQVRVEGIDQPAAGSIAAAKSGDDDAGIENETHATSLPDIPIGAICYELENIVDQTWSPCAPVVRLSRPRVEFFTP